MARYGNFLYGTAKYGEAAKLLYSVEPMSIVVIGFGEVYVSWQQPRGNFSKIRLVRNQIQFPETAEDGVIIWEEYASEGSVSKSDFKDGEENTADIPIIKGRPIYYSMFLFTDSNVWVRAGSVSDVVPDDHGTQQRFIDLLPRVYTSKVQSPLGVADDTTALYYFVDGLSITLEQLKTYLDLLRPKHTADISSHKLLPIEFIGRGLDLEPLIPLRNQKMLARESLYMYAHKGLKTGIETYAESLTGYAPTVTLSPNLLLSVQDSTFYNSVGNWVTSGCTLEASTAQVPVTTDYVIDTIYSGKVTAIGSSYITLGADDPILKGIPVTGGNDYTFSYKIKSPSSAGNTQMIVTWYDMYGHATGSADSLTSVAANNTWKTSWQTKTAPADAVYASLKITFSASGVYYVDQVYAEDGENLDNTTYQEARAIDIFLEANKTNYINNPSFETNTTDGWTKTGLATVTQDVDIPTDAYTGTSSAKIVTTGLWEYTCNNIPMTPGDYYTFSFYCKTSDTFYVQTKTYDDLSNQVDIWTEEITGNGDWSRYSVTVLADAGSEATNMDVTFTSGTALTMYIDCVQLEQSPKPSDYFDGSLPGNFGVVWEGTTNNSYSRMYYSKAFKVPRLAQTISGWIGPNLFWKIRTYEGVEYTNLTV